MSKKSSKKKKAVEVVPVSVRPLRDLTKRAVVDGLSGALGIDDITVREAVHSARGDLVAFKVLSEVRAGTREVDLGSRELHELPPGILPDLASFRTLGLARNFLVAGVFEQLSDMACLERLDLSENLISGGLPVEAGALSELRWLSLYANMLVTLSSGAFAWTRLQHLDLRANDLVAVPRECFEAWRRIEFLDLRNNKLTEVPSEISNCECLTQLLLSGNRLVSVPPEIGKIKTLRVLALANNEIVELPPPLSGCSELQLLNISGNKIASFHHDTFARWTKLVELHMFKNQVSELPHSFCALERLQKLNMSNNKFAVLPDPVLSLSNLQELYLNGNPLTAIPEGIEKLAALVELSLQLTKLKQLPLQICGLKNLRCLDVRSGGKKEACKLQPLFPVAVPRCLVKGGVVQKAKKSSKKGAGKDKRK